jgi:hypothetical protein
MCVGLVGGFGGRLKRGMRLLAVAAAMALLIALLLVLPQFWGTLPDPIRHRPIESFLVGLMVGYGGLQWYCARRMRRGANAGRAGFALFAIDCFSEWAMRRGLAIALGVVCAVLLLCWIPHYLTWPWDRDADTYATLALGWNRGIAPYRDVLVFNFPGHIYLHWVLGKICGWGQGAAFYAVDSAALVALGIMLAAWSRRVWGSAIPGILSYLAFLEFYLGLDGRLVAQRDFHATLLMVLALLAAEAWPGRRSRIVAAALAGVAFTIRPHIVLFLPAMASAVVEHVERLEGQGREKSRALLEWAMSFVLITVLLFAPLIWGGLIDDLVRGVRIAAYGGPFSKATTGGALKVLADELRSRSTQAVFVGCLLLTLLGAVRQRHMARTWLLALAGALIYRPLHPVQHAYLGHALELTQTVALAVPIGWMLTMPWLDRPVRALLVVLLAYIVLPSIPRFCSATDSIRAIRPLVRGEEPEIAPMGQPQFFHQDAPLADYYQWSDYRATLAYLRKSTTPNTFVGNLLKEPPYPPMNGPTGRPSPFRTESGMCWMVVVDMDMDADFARSLEQCSDAVVVRDPRDHDPRLALKRTTAVIERDFQLEARFGTIEVWRKKARRKSRETS